jgi:hypothetical protein
MHATRMLRIRSKDTGGAFWALAKDFSSIAFKGLDVKEVLSSETSGKPYLVTQLYASVVYGSSNHTGVRNVKFYYLSSDYVFTASFILFIQACRKGKPLANQVTN